ncbi:MAG TPA: class I SAM-dependent methyltransferase [Flavipsychrobacter sp.]|nr:class I SAM-dependent methyltransferase [Flavipsychrobacter sp.]
MKDVQDNFSGQAGVYAKFRPVAPDELYQFLFDKVPGFDAAWDCGTGNGQAANKIAERFKVVYATDISEQQLNNAIKRDNIIYKVERAEKASFPDNSFDLITVAQAIHWFDFEQFYNEVKRVGKPESIIAVWTYKLLYTNSLIDVILDDFYSNLLGPYWDKERKYVDDEYKTIPFPFEEIATPKFEIKANWQLTNLIGYLNSWSSVQHYIKKEGVDPVQLYLPKFKEHWNDHEIKQITFPLFLRAGRIKK